MPSWSGELSHYLKQIKSTHDDDGIDRLNYVTTIYLLLAFALTIFAKNYVGEPLQCWVPNQWTGIWEAFAESYCFVENTYFVPMNNTQMPETNKRENMEMIYYQWVPFILSLMAFFFYLPRAAWRSLSSYSGLALSDMMTAARASQKRLDDKGKVFASFAQSLEQRVEYKGTTPIRYGKSLFNIYIIMKILIWLNLLLQFYFLNHFLGTEYLFWGFGILIDMVNGRHWQASGHFPRVAFCDITVREMGNVNNWTVQCVLMVNMFNEKIFIFLWWWLAVVLILTTGNVIYWFWNRFSSSRRTSFISDLRKDAGINDEYSESEKAFYNEVLMDDGVLVLRLVDLNAGRIQSCALFKLLWEYKFPATKVESSPSDEDDDDDKSLLLKKGKTCHPVRTPVKQKPSLYPIVESPSPEELDDSNLSSFDENYPCAPTASV